MKELSLILVSLFTFLFLTASPVAANQTYTDAVQNLTPISLTEVEKKIDQGEDFYLYTGRVTCKYCKKFAPKLGAAQKSTKTKVYYLDSKAADQTALAAFTKNYKIETVPNLSFFSDKAKKAYMEKGSQSTEAEIKTFLKAYKVSSGN